jgi:hypothetical protein
LPWTNTVFGRAVISISASYGWVVLSISNSPAVGMDDFWGAEKRKGRSWLRSGLLENWKLMAC